MAEAAKDRILREGVRVHGNDFVLPGDTVEAVCLVQGLVEKGACLVVADIIVIRQLPVNVLEKDWFLKVFRIRLLIQIDLERL
ncbi:MAG: hypothetical protein UT33_C0013G0032 [Candidatus Peregrinibacteria bacterium GW2011_GWC2_39_14]|nr:MAG: hypothetical protein US92_C0007G0083 [Candidatus Peregrinibacteria bacterium GW2011_GWA2_38_36]KKR05180.1 MAG: hypothetical protein UT33_C0013G0032 [Candidatus Peregrinibacteria bacterium GW2011_GWC2_39_14]